MLGQDQIDRLASRDVYGSDGEKREPITDANRDAALAGQGISEDEHEVVLHEEQPVVEKETVPLERVRLDTETVTDEQTVAEEVRRERVEVEPETTRG